MRAFHLSTILLWTLSGCIASASPSGFLGDYSDFEPGPGVMVVRAAITDVVPTRPLLNLATSVPPARGASMAKRVITGTHLFVGRVSIEAEVLDSVTGERLVAYVDRAAGGKMNPVRGLTTWGQVKAALDDWAAKLRQGLDTAHSESAD